MKRIHQIAIGTLGLALVATACLTTPSSAQQDQWQGRRDLLGRINTLEKRIAFLEAEIRALKAQRTITTIPAIPGQRIQPLPPGWKEGQFNGLKYYIVPCEEGQTSATISPANEAKVAPTVRTTEVQRGETPKE